MIIKNKKTEIEYIVTQEQWQDIKKLGEQVKFQIISQDAYVKEKSTEKPIEVISFINENKKVQTKKLKTKK